MLKLRQFTFRNHSVLWMTGSRRDIAGLMRAIQKRQRGGDRKIPIDDLAQVENPGGLRLFVVSHEAQPIEEGEYHWPCLRTPGIDSFATKLNRLMQSRSLDESFDLWPAPAQLLIESSEDAGAGPQSSPPSSTSSDPSNGGSSIQTKSPAPS